MKILTASQIKEADRYTIENEPISSTDLMERASNRIASWISEHVDNHHPLVFFIGKGNNGGDGLAVARLLYHAGYECTVVLAYSKEYLSTDALENLTRLPSSIPVCSDENFNLTESSIVIDALLGTGVKGAVNEKLSSFIQRLNNLPNRIISIDMPSGLETDFPGSKPVAIQATITLTLEFPKLSMLLPETGEFCGEIIVLPIGIHPDYIAQSGTDYHYLTADAIKALQLPRAKFGYKNNFGHALLICGSAGMMGAAILATGAALRSGCGLVTAHIPADERHSLQAKYPSAMISLDKESAFSQLPPTIGQYTAIGIGCGLSQNNDSVKALEQLLKTAQQPMVIDADALNILAAHKHLLSNIPKSSILTPHVGELRRLIGNWENEEEKVQRIKQLSRQLQSIIILKGAHTMVCFPSGDCYFNSTGNSGMAKGGSGDVLTGLLTGLLARGYSSESAALIGVFHHGLAGDIAAQELGEESMNSADLIDNIHL